MKCVKNERPLPGEPSYYCKTKSLSKPFNPHYLLPSLLVWLLGVLLLGGAYFLFKLYSHYND